jgi:hypothetical protein
MGKAKHEEKLFFQDNQQKISVNRMVRLFCVLFHQLSIQAQHYQGFRQEHR